MLNAAGGLSQSICHLPFRGTATFDEEELALILVRTAKEIIHGLVKK